ncbi:MAG: tRNA (guanosine(18)-2'-O)-methyltransferase TrmH [Coleofasciculaceae cyanobacterium SM2_3_26]|nr:tRNA (guanosine(18)-2'-O)-methyltransferase TrmH [Coleofasciculaceae cyanobacterium SM2_3_26]
MTPERYQKIRAVLDRRQPDLTAILEDLDKPHNFSAILRTCDAVGVHEAHAVHTYTEIPTFNKVAQGSQKWVQLVSHITVEAAIAHLHQRHFRIYAAHLSDTSIDYCQVDYTKPTAILLGAERWGVSDRAAARVDGHIIIPMQGMVESLNVSVAAAVILFEANRQRMAAGMYDRVRLDATTYQRLLFELSYPSLAATYQAQQKPYPLLNEAGEILQI